jgi:hypothetical protein
MKQYRKRADCVDFDARERRSAPRAIRKLADRFGLSIERASAIAAANGYGIRYAIQ